MTTPLLVAGGGGGASGFLGSSTVTNFGSYTATFWPVADARLWGSPGRALTTGGDAGPNVGGWGGANGQGGNCTSSATTSGACLISLFWSFC